MKKDNINQNHSSFINKNHDHSNLSNELSKMNSSGVYINNKNSISENSAKSNTSIKNSRVQELKKNKETYNYLNNNLSSSKNFQSLDNLLTTDNLIRNTEERFHYKSSGQNQNGVENLNEKNTIMMNIMLNQLNRFNNHQNNDSHNEIFNKKINNYSRQITLENYLKETSREKPNLVNFKMSPAEKISMQERVFWTKEKLENIKIKFRMAKEKIKKKTELDFLDLHEAIEDGEREKIL